MSLCEKMSAETLAMMSLLIMSLLTLEKDTKKAK